jgi:hypothetical protein
MKPVTLCCLVLCLAAAASGTALGDLAASMAPGTWKLLPGTGLTYDLIDAGNAQVILEYSESCVWDPNTEQVLFCGQGHYAAFRFIGYDAATNEWRKRPDPSWMGGIGHSYDHNAIDEARGRFYFVKYSGSQIYEYNTATSSWRTLTSIPSSVGNVTCCKALEYFPELNGLVVVGGGNVGLYNTSTGQWSSLASGLAMGIYEHFAEYSPVAKAMFFGGGAGDRNVYKLDASGRVTKLGNAPFGLGANQSTVTVDPVSGVFLVNSADKQLYTFDITTDTWTQIYPFLPFRTFTTIATPVSSHGVVLYFAGDYNTAPTVYIYKHSAGTAVQNNARSAAGQVVMTAEPNPFNTAVAITVNGNAVETLHPHFDNYRFTGCNVSTVSIFDIHGRMVHRAGKPVSGTYTWSPAGLPAGLYTARVTLGNRVFSKRLVLVK